MSDLTLPTGILVSKWTFGQKTYDFSFENSSSGAQQVVVAGPSRWMVTMGYEVNLKPLQAATWRALVLGLKGRANRLALYDIANPVPQGTMRGAMTTVGALAAGANSMTINAPGQATKTLLSGDWLSIGSGNTKQLVHVQSEATSDASGNITVAFQPQLRYAQLTGATVVWNKPTAFFRRTDDTTQWEAQGPVHGGFNLQLLESWET